MPTGNYSYAGSNLSRPMPISEPGGDYGRSSNNGVLAKEPDRQTARRGTSSNRGRAAVQEQDEQADQPRGRSAQRGASAKGAQARRGSDRSTSARRSAGTDSKTRQKKSRRGFAAMSAEQQREIARKGGLTVSRNRRHMADIGRVGGEHSHGGRRARR